MLIALALAAAVSGVGARPKPIEVRGADMVCVGTGAHLTFWEGPSGAPTRLLAADVRAGETVVVDMTEWKTVTRPLLSLKAGQFGYQAVGGSVDSARPERSVLDCSSASAKSMVIRVVNFAGL
jgi:hypothetical protein